METKRTPIYDYNGDLIGIFSDKEINDAGGLYDKYWKEVARNYEAELIAKMEIIQLQKRIREAEMWGYARFFLFLGVIALGLFLGQLVVGVL
jgi:hypothetical protein